MYCSVANIGHADWYNASSNYLYMLHCFNRRHPVVFHFSPQNKQFIRAKTQYYYIIIGIYNNFIILRFWRNKLFYCKLHWLSVSGCSIFVVGCFVCNAWSYVAASIARPDSLFISSPDNHRNKPTSLIGCIFMLLSYSSFMTVLCHFSCKTLLILLLCVELLLLLWSSSSSSSSSSSPLCRVFIFRNTVLQLFCCYYSWCLFR